MSSSRPFESYYAAPSRNGVAPPKASRGSGVPMINMGDLFGHPRITGHDMERVPLRPNEMARALLEPGDLLFARRSLKWSGAGVCSIFLGADEPTTFESSLIRVRLDEAAADPLFFFYYFRSPVGRRSMETIIEQTAVAGIKASELARLEILIPPLAAQRRIASVLNALDEKIESNRHVAETLHELAGLQFKHRFGDLAPASATAAGWSEGALGDLVDVNMGQSPPGSTYSSDPSAGLLLVQGMGGMGDRFPTSDVFTTAPTKVATAGTTLMTVRAPVGAVNVAHVEVCLGRGVAGISSPRPAFTEYLVRALKPRWSAEESGTIFPAVNRKQIVGLPVAVPPESELDAFEELAAPVVRKLNALHGETEALTALRDELLPKLVSGKLRVPPDDAGSDHGELTA